eukprot:TRINITY_DN30077_c0_g1_i2.p1 TRINITY_DN30077_c0_g1~~TRINITY_DN30077_c0_g1_i2.p1  ORF type:complete len:734 (+),score=148.78 TRINITY_DN30077_c0_g1_i2:72-2273(+)
MCIRDSLYDSWYITSAVPDLLAAAQFNSDQLSFPELLDAARAADLARCLNKTSVDNLVQGIGCEAVELTRGVDGKQDAVALRVGETLWVGVRGTHTVADVYADLDFTTPSPLPGHEGWGVSSSVLRRAQDLCDQITQLLRTTSSSQEGRTSRLRLCGHSLGGSIATVTLLLLSQDPVMEGIDLRCITLGAPLVLSTIPRTDGSDPDFRHHCHDQCHDSQEVAFDLPAAVYNIVLQYDVVPRLLGNHDLPIGLASQCFPAAASERLRYRPAGSYMLLWRDGDESRVRRLAGHREAAHMLSLFPDSVKYYGCMLLDHKSGEYRDHMVRAAFGGFLVSHSTVWEDHEARSPLSPAQRIRHHIQSTSEDWGFGDGALHDIGDLCSIPRRVAETLAVRERFEAAESVGAASQVLRETGCLFSELVFFIRFYMQQGMQMPEDSGFLSAAPADDVAHQSWMEQLQGWACMRAIASRLEVEGLDFREWRDAMKINQLAADALNIELPKGPPSVVAPQLCQLLGLTVDVGNVQHEAWTMQIDSKLRMMTCCANFVECMINAIFFATAAEAADHREPDRGENATESCLGFLDNLDGMDERQGLVCHLETDGHVFLIEFPPPAEEEASQPRQAWLLQSHMDTMDSQVRSVSLDEIREQAGDLHVFTVYRYEIQNVLGRYAAAFRLCFCASRLGKCNSFEQSEVTWNFVLNFVRFMNLRQRQFGTRVWHEIPAKVDEYIRLTSPW